MDSSILNTEISGKNLKKQLEHGEILAPPKSTIVAYYLRSMVLETEYIEDHYK